MLVKQVFSRSMGVWIFAVALLVGEVYCAYSREQVNGFYRKAKHLISHCLRGRIKLMWEYHLMEEATIEYTKGLDKIVDNITSIDPNLTSFKPLRLLDPSHTPNCYEMKTKCCFQEEVPDPFLDSLLKLVRVQTLQKSLTQVSPLLKQWSRVDSLKNGAKSVVLHMITILGELPVFAKFNREMYLPKETTGVSFQDVINLHSEMNTRFRRFLPTGDGIEWDAALKHFMQLEHRKDIVANVRELFETCLFYRLAVSELYTVYIEDYPDALLYTRFLQETLRKLHRFVSWLEIIPSQEISGGDKLDETDEYLQPSVLSDLKRVLDHGRTALEPTSPLKAHFSAKGRPSLFLKVFAKFEAMSHFFRTYELMKERLNAVEEISSDKAGSDTAFFNNAGSDIEFLVAFTDDISANLDNILQSRDVTTICDNSGNDTQGAVSGVRSIYGDGEQKVREELCVLREEAHMWGANYVAPYDRRTSFFHHFITKYPKFSATTPFRLTRANLKSVREAFTWTNVWKQGLDEINNIISEGKLSNLMKPGSN